MATAATTREADVTAGRFRSNSSFMTKRTPTGNYRPKPGKSKAGKASAPAAASPLTPPVASSEKLTPEEQMERFAKELKNEDWGHQPC